MKHLDIQNPTVTKRAHESGFTIVEALISMTIFVLVTGTVFSLLDVARGTRKAIDTQVQLTKGNRISLNLLGKDTYNAGYGYPVDSPVVLPQGRLSTLLGIPPDPDLTRDLAPPIIAGNDVRLNALNSNPAARTDQITFLFKDTTFNRINSLDPGAPEDTRVSSPISVLNVVGNDRTRMNPADVALVRPNDLVLIAGSTSSTLVTATGMTSNEILFSNGDTLALNLAAAGGPLSGITGTASMMRVSMVTYFVANDGTLTRRRYANDPLVGSFIDEPMIYGVEDLQIRYVLNDGSVTDDPAPNRLQAIRQVQYNITTRTTELRQNGNPNRKTQSTTYSTRNLGYDSN